MEPFAITRGLCHLIQVDYHRPKSGFCATTGKAIRLALYTLALLVAFLIDLCAWPLSSKPQPAQQYVPVPQYVPTSDAFDYSDPSELP